MKTYLLFFVFFINFLSLPLALLAQEESSTSSVLPHDIPENPSSYSEKPSTLPHEIPEMWLDDQQNYVKERESDNFQSKFFNMLIILGLLIGFMILASWSLKRMMKTKISSLNTNSHIKILETRYLSPRATLYLVEIQNKAFFIAESPTSVTYLTTFPLEESVNKN